MLQSLSVKGFRGFDSIQVERLGRINLILGKNSVGKTALLEALWLHRGYFAPDLSLRINSIRGYDVVLKDEFLNEIFYNSEAGVEKSIEIQGIVEDIGESVLQLKATFQEDSLIARNETENGDGGSSLSNRQSTTPGGWEIRSSYTEKGVDIIGSLSVDHDGIRVKRPQAAEAATAVFFSSTLRSTQQELTQRLSEAERLKRKREMVEILKIVEPRINDVIVLNHGGNPVVFGDIGMEKLLPLSLMGDGINRLLAVALAIPFAENGYVFIDEFENGYFHSALKDVWKHLIELARKYSVQLFATTHSQECIRAAVESGSAGDDFLFHRIEKGGVGHKVSTFGVEDASVALDSNLEIR